MSNATIAADIQERRNRFEHEMESRGLDAVVVASEGNAVYFTAYETTFWVNKSKPFLVVLVPGRRPLVVCHRGERPSVELDAIDVDVLSYDGPSPIRREERVDFDFHLLAMEKLSSVLVEVGGNRIGMELGWHFIPQISQDAIDHLRRLVSPRELVDASPALWAVRSVKTDWEIDHMRSAAQMLGVAHELFAERAHVGMSERELSRLLASCGIEVGGERVTYTGVVAGTDRVPLGGPTDRVWKSGQLVGTDLTFTVRNYWADFCRIYAGGEKTAAQERAYADLAQTLVVARSRIHPGATVGEVAQAMLADGAAYSRVGHGLGLDMPEPPSLVAEDETALEAGMILCLEPNREFEGVGWLTVEEMIVVTDDGYELLGPAFPPELLVLN